MYIAIMCTHSNHQSPGVWRTRSASGASGMCARAWWRWRGWWRSRPQPWTDSICRLPSLHG